MKSNTADPQILSAAALRAEIGARNQARAAAFAHELTWSASPSVLYAEADGLHGNFLPAAWARIQANPAWRKRLAKSYTASRYVPRAGDRRRFELDCAASSDALLMNIFCYPKVLHRSSLCALLGIEPGHEPDFGYRPAPPPSTATSTVPRSTCASAASSSKPSSPKATSSARPFTALATIPSSPKFSMSIDCLLSTPTSIPGS